MFCDFHMHRVIIKILTLFSHPCDLFLSISSSLFLSHAHTLGFNYYFIGRFMSDAFTNFYSPFCCCLKCVICLLCCVCYECQFSVNGKCALLKHFPSAVWSIDWSVAINNIYFLRSFSPLRLAFRFIFIFFHVYVICFV